MEVEYIAASEAVMEAVWLKEFLSTLKIIESVSKPVVLYCDNQAAIKVSRDPKFHSKSKHIEGRYHYIRDVINRLKLVSLEFLPSTNMIADCKARYAVLFQIRTFPPEPKDEAHIGPTATYDEVIYPGFQHDIIALQIQGYNISYKRHTSARIQYISGSTCLSTDYKQMPKGKGKKHRAHVSARIQDLRRGPLASRRRVFAKASRRRIVELH